MERLESELQSFGLGYEEPFKLTCETAIMWIKIKHSEDPNWKPDAALLKSFCDDPSMKTCPLCTGPTPGPDPNPKPDSDDSWLEKHKLAVGLTVAGSVLLVVFVVGAFVIIKK
jgi:hypothetical protein